MLWSTTPAASAAALKYWLHFLRFVVLNVVSPGSSSSSSAAASAVKAMKSKKLAKREVMEGHVFQFSRCHETWIHRNVNARIWIRSSCPNSSRCIVSLWRRAVSIATAFGMQIRFHSIPTSSNWGHTFMLTTNKCKYLAQLLETSAWGPFTCWLMEPLRRCAKYVASAKNFSSDCSMNLK